MSSQILKNLIRTYDRNLVNARRLARLKSALSKSGAEDSSRISREAKRRQLVQRVSREIVESLIVSDTSNAMVTEIKQELEKEFGHKLLFRYPPEGDGLHIFKETAEGAQKIEGEEQERILQKLWQLTMDKVNETIL
jgi:signal recognition particle GTPase